MVFMVKTKRGEYSVYVSDRDAERVKNYAYFSGEERVKDYRSAKDPRDKNGYPLRVVDYSGPLYSWHIVWKAGKIDAVATDVRISAPGTKCGYRTKQVKLHEYIMGEVPHCKGIRHRDGNPLNNRRENLVLYQAYRTEKLDYATKGGKRTDICIGCKDDATCQKVPTCKKILKTEVKRYEN
jgi:hypothetical protein